MPNAFAHNWLLCLLRWYCGSGCSGGRSGGYFCVCINGVGGGFWCMGGDSGGFLLVNVVFVVVAVDKKSRHFKTFSFIQCSTPRPSQPSYSRVTRVLVFGRYDPQKLG